ncbi:magnesium-dependent phosphatase-1 [Auriculariales sp. MPI-PUGE-AT-0066]|nr:magnesium-dependent phosphatase-1 [Auriculariales sp. MPI-PUGE-AT-0066]
MTEPDTRMPQLIAFDLDFTLWHLWINCHATPPFKRKSGEPLNEIWDARGSKISFYPDVPNIIATLRSTDDMKLALCSRTHAPPAAREALDLLLVKDETGATRPSREFFDLEEIYPGSKLAHFRSLHKRTGIPYEQMLFFDDEYRNSEVSQLGVVFHLVDRGVNHATFDKGIEKWRDSLARTDE